MSPDAGGAHRDTASFERKHAILSVVTAGLMVIAVIALITVGGTTLRGVAIPPTPPSPAVLAPSTSIGTSKPLPSKHPVKRLKPITCSHPAGDGGATPIRVCIPQIRVDASVLSLGLNKNRTVQVPTLAQVADAGWYRYSAQPGAIGPAVILGHVDSAVYGEGVFFLLGTLHSGDRIVVVRGDGRVATFVVVKVDEVSKTHFPTQSVYGPTSGPAIRLVTCGGPFDSATGNYLDNIIVYGTLVSLSKA